MHSQRTTPHSVLSIVMSLQRRLERLHRMGNAKAAALDLPTLQRAIDLAGATAKTAHRRSHLNAHQVSFEVPEAIGFVLLNQLRKHPARWSKLDLLTLIRHARHACHVDEGAVVNLRRAA